MLFNIALSQHIRAKTQTAREKNVGMGIKSKAKEKVKELKKVKSKLKEGAAALAGIERNDDEESIAEKRQDKAEGEEGKVVKKGNGVPKVGSWFVVKFMLHAY